MGNFEKIYSESVSEIRESWLSSNSDEWYAHVLSLDQKHRVVYLVSTLHQQVMNGGFHQYFSNSYGQFAKEACEALNIIGLEDIKNLLVKALEVVKPTEMSMSVFRRNLRERSLPSLFHDDDLFEPLEKLDDAYFENENRIVEALESYAD